MYPVEKEVFGDWNPNAAACCALAMLRTARGMETGPGVAWPHDCSWTIRVGMMHAESAFANTAMYVEALGFELPYRGAGVAGDRQNAGMPTLAIGSIHQAS
jgi:hypothetical protein